MVGNGVVVLGSVRTGLVRCYGGLLMEWPGPLKASETPGTPCYSLA